MKIAFDAKRFFQNNSGLGNYSRDLVRMLAKYYPENIYLLLNQNRTDKGSEILKADSIEFVEVPKSFLARQFKMGILAEKEKAAIFHGLSGELPLKWKNTDIKKIVTIHDLIFLRFPKYYSLFDRKMHFWKFKKAALSADLVIAISEQTKKDIVQFLKIPESKIRVVYQGCHESFKQNFSKQQLEDIRQKFSLPERFVLNVGTVEERKNLLNVIKALQKTDIPLIVIGKKKKNYFRKIKNEIRKSGVEVRFLENVSMEDLAAVYRLADIFIYPSLFEGFGIPVIEALFSETAVITSNVSSLPEAGGAFSTYINPRNVADIKAKIMHLWDNEAERKRRAEKGLEFVQKFSDKKIAHQMMSVYNEVL